MFNLVDYAKYMREAAKDGTDVHAVVSKFVYNLATMRPSFDEFSDEVDFRMLGQEWNNLSSDVRNSQRNEVTQQLVNITSIM